MTPQWDSVGPRRGVTWIDLVRPASGESVEVIAVADHVEGVWLHWVDGQTVPCTGAEEGCPYHHGPREGELRWKGYLAAVRQLGGGIVIAEVTAEAWCGAPLLRALSDADALRGVRVKLFRRRGGSRRPVAVALPDADRVIDRAALLPACPDVRAAVSILWERSAARAAEQNGEKEEG